MHVYTLIHGCVVDESPIPLLSTCKHSNPAVWHPSFLAIGYSLPHSIGCARYLGYLPPGHGFCGDYDVFKLVLGNDIDGVGICEKLDRAECLSCTARTNANNQRAYSEATDGVLHNVWRASS